MSHKYIYITSIIKLYFLFNV